MPEVLAAASYEAARVYFHDDNTSPEPTGFWIMGQRSKRMTIAPVPGTPAIALRLRSPVANRVQMRSRSWRRTVELAPDESQEVLLPDASHGVISVTIETSDGFVPAERDPGVSDRRFLGAWIEVVATGN